MDSKYRLHALNERMPNWADAPKTWCERCTTDVRAQFFDDHLWVVHGQQAELLPMDRHVPGGYSEPIA